MMYKFLNNQKGGALVTVILVMVVLAIIGISLLNTSLAEAKLAIRQERKTQAYYIALSGAEGVAEALNQDPVKPGKLVSLLNNGKITNGLIANGKYEVEVTGTDVNEKFIIESEGTIGNVKESLMLEMKKFDFSELLMFGNTININGNKAKLTGGDIYYRTSYNFFDSIVKDGAIIQKDITFDEPEIPAGITLASIGDIVLTGSDKAQLPGVNQHVEIDIVSQTSNSSELTLTANGDTYIKADSFKVNGGNIILKGNGRILLFTSNFEGGGNFITEEGSKVTFVICIPSGGNLKMGGTPSFEGAIYAPNATVDLQGTVDFTGSVIADTIDGGGDIILNQKKLGIDDILPTIYTKLIWKN